MKKTSKSRICKILIKICSTALGIFFLFIYVTPIFFNIFNIGNIVGITASVCLIIFGLFLDKIILIVRKIRKSRTKRICFDIVFSGACAVLLSFCFALGTVAVCATTNAEKEDTVIVLGCAVYGETPSIMLRARVDAAYAYLRQNEKAVAILSGGQGNGESISEAECMFRLLKEKGIDESHLYIEEKSTNTNENIKNSLAVIKENNLSTDIAIASSDYHLKRATMIAHKNGVAAKRISAKSNTFDIPVFYVRDALGVIKEFVF